MRLGPRELLEHNSKYKVLICRECHYAIQKNALRSHLLRHKIYREEKLRLMSIIRQLDIVEPDELSLPSPGTRAIDALPVVSGYSCTMTGCAHLCASSKRMTRHWSDVHGVTGSNNFASHARSVSLQTFFRGTKVKYFEVSVEGTVVESERLAEGGGHDRNDFSENGAPSSAQLIPLSGSSPVVDLDTLAYFHHYTMTTCLTLPKVEDSPSTSKYWGIYIVCLALRQQWLMCGILAISAYHSATLGDETATQQKHFERATKFRSDFFVGFNQIMNNTLHDVSVDNLQETKTAAIQVRCIMSCARWTLTGLTTSQETVLGLATSPSRLGSLICDIQNLASSGLENSLEIEQTNVNRLQISSNTNSLQSTATASTLLLNRLQMLPYRMAEIFGKPDDERDAPAILLGIEALLRYSNGLPSAWQSISAWLNETTDHFNNMVFRQNSAALIVLAHWAAILVRWTETYECWYIHGFSRALYSLISEHLSTDYEVHCLIEDLLG